MVERLVVAMGLLGGAVSQDLFEASNHAGIPTLQMQNAAEQGMQFPVMGLGVEGHGWKIGQKMECWHWPQCCTKDYCPSVNAVADYIKEAVSRGGIARIDTGYPYGDNAHKSEQPICYPNTTSTLLVKGRRLHPSCDTRGIGIGIKNSGARREQVFVTIKLGYAGPMAGTTVQTKSILHHLDIQYADLCLVHLPEVGPGTGSHGEYKGYHCVPGIGPYNDTYDAAKCRVLTYQDALGEIKAGRCKAVGVNNWNVSDIEEIEKAGLQLPSVVQYKFHLHQSAANSVQRDLLAYTQKKGIILNGFAPLGAPDWVTFTGEGMKATTLEEPIVQEVARKVGKTPAQVLLRWVTQQGVATHARTMKLSHMQENLDIFNWELAADDMKKLSSMPQCTTQRGCPYAEGDPNGHKECVNPSVHGVIGLTEHC